jgi:hypothetical protein
MDDKLLWDLFQETGDPLGYLLYAANARISPERASDEKRTPPEEGRLDAPPVPPAVG